MPELTKPIIGVPVLEVAEGGVHVEVVLGRNSNLQLVLGLLIRVDLPVVDATIHPSIPDDGPEHVRGLFEKDGLPVVGDRRAGPALPLVPPEGVVPLVIPAAQRPFGPRSAVAQSIPADSPVHLHELDDHLVRGLPVRSDLDQLSQ